MAAKLCPYLLVVTVLLLVIMGLNISNQGINSLTLENRNPIIGWQDKGDEFNIFAMGEAHSYDKREVREDVISFWQQIKMEAQATGDSLLQYRKNL
ncbi:MAG: hypothetical protein PHF24_03210 [Syntrophomonas sp.]|nr:hypothetical protein [Syntrophomonas sp.]